MDSSQINGNNRSSDDRVLEVIFNPELPAEEVSYVAAEKYSISGKNNISPSDKICT